MVQRLLILCILLTQAHLAYGFSMSVTGASSSAVLDPAAPSVLTVNGGYAIPSHCATRDGSTTCNSCNGVNIEVASGTNAPAPCNPNSIYDELPLIVTVESDKTDISTLAMGVAKASEYSGNQIDGINLVAVNGRTYTFQATWAQLATAFSLSFTCTTQPCGGLKTLYFGPVKDDKFVEYVTLKINFSIVNYSSLSTPYNGITKGLATWCTPTSLDPLTSNVASTGLCYFEMFPGDEKAYIANFIAGWGSSPVDPDTSLTYANLTMFYAEKAAGASVLETLKSVTNLSAHSSVGLATTVGDPLSSYKIEGLENSSADVAKTYCFVPALQDATGTFLYFLNFQASGITPEQFNGMCASPSEVVGILSDKDCFIATVAFGSRNHVFLDVLREFRNKYLHPFSWGKKFIKFYYANGLTWAKSISENTLAKAVVKVTLLPIIAIAFLVLNPLWLCVVSGFGFLGYRRWMRRGPQ
jgi:hypothetical protein